ncbi:M12 family metallopeptidase [Ruegeria sp. 2205SS24-7]|uniref:M12 family metallopeptidase n=1 Tax=Ruegeria discodermiae TaxID=3064389 RepID=UPI0027411821|nr:M12 family metallopeptidase [Ruegeria sp. 2205SS24-7]MDP5220044.1 M12 family metallopeptidase [Ruegeria sp. 2205SS24-7]
MLDEEDARAAYPAAFEGLDSSQIDRLRVFQMTGTDVDAGASVLGQFAVNEEGGPEQVFLENYRWPQQKILTACFFDGGKAEILNVLRVFDSVLEFTNLGLAVTQESCPVRGVDIQIRIKTSGCSSYYGRAARDVIAKNENEATINLCNRARPSLSGRNEATITHEFLHTLGFVHEQQHSDQKCYDELDLEKVGRLLFPKYDAEKREEAVRNNILKIEKSVPQAVVAKLPYDKKSMTHYRLTKNMFKKGVAPTCVLSQKNLVLSEGDKRMLRAMYPSGASSRTINKGIDVPLSAAKSLEAIVGEASENQPIDDAMSDCLTDEGCQQAVLFEINNALASRELGATRVAPELVGVQAAGPALLVTTPKPEPGTGGTGCQVWPFCVQSGENLHEQRGFAIDQDGEGLVLQAQANDPFVQAPQRDEMPGVGGGLCQGLIFCMPDEQALAMEPAGPLQAPGPLGPICLLNPLCSGALKGLNNNLLGLDQGVVGQ